MAKGASLNAWVGALNCLVLSDSVGTGNERELEGDRPLGAVECRGQCGETGMWDRKSQVFCAGWDGGILGGKSRDTLFGGMRILLILSSVWKLSFFSCCFIVFVVYPLVHITHSLP